MSVPPAPAQSNSDAADAQSGMLPERSTLRRGDFLRATRHGRRVVTQHFLLFVYERKDPGATHLGKRHLGETRLGITVTRKVGNAVRRNRIKRLVREWFRLSKTGVPASGRPACDLIVIAKRGISHRLTLADVQSDLDTGLEAGRAGSRSG